MTPLCSLNTWVQILGILRFLRPKSLPREDWNLKGKLHALVLGARLDTKFLHYANECHNSTSIQSLVVIFKNIWKADKSISNPLTNFNEKKKAEKKNCGPKTENFLEYAPMHQYVETNINESNRYWAVWISVLRYGGFSQPGTREALRFAAHSQRIRVPVGLWTCLKERVRLQLTSATWLWTRLCFGSRLSLAPAGIRPRDGLFHSSINFCNQ